VAKLEEQVWLSPLPGMVRVVPPARASTQRWPRLSPDVLPEDGAEDPLIAWRRRAGDGQGHWSAMYGARESVMGFMPSAAVGAIGVSGTPALVTGNATWFSGLGSPYGGCGLPQANLDSQNFLALNVQNRLTGTTGSILAVHRGAWVNGGPSAVQVAAVPGREDEATAGRATPASNVPHATRPAPRTKAGCPRRPQITPVPRIE
jgi:hypothetical protein